MINYTDRLVPLYYQKREVSGLCFCAMRKRFTFEVKLDHCCPLSANA